MTVPAEPGMASSSLSPEGRILLATAGGPGGEATLRALLSADVDWARLLAISLKEGAQPVLGRRVRGIAGDRIPEPIATDMRQVERAGEFRQRYLERRLRDAVEVLSAAGVRVLLLKGAALAHRVFGDFAQRPMSDVDLLVAPEDAGAARGALLDSGWERRFGAEYDAWYQGMHHLPPLLDSRTPALRVGLEIHTELFAEARNPFDFSAADLWREFAPVKALPEGVGTSSLEMHLLHCAVHHAWSHRLAGAGWRSFRDTAAIVVRPEFAWDRFAALVEATETAAPVYWSLALSRGLAGAAVPDVVLAGLRPRRSARSLRWLERHFMHEAVDAERICPSERLRTAIWLRAMEGGSAVRQAARPDRRSWRRLQDPEASEGTPPLWSRDALSPSAWVNFLRRVAG